MLELISPSTWWGPGCRYHAGRSGIFQGPISRQRPDKCSLGTHWLSWAGTNLPELLLPAAGRLYVAPSFLPRDPCTSVWAALGQTRTRHPRTDDRHGILFRQCVPWTLRASSPPVRPPLPSPLLGHKRVRAEGSVPSPRVTRVGGDLGMDRKMAVSPEAWHTQRSESVLPSSGLQHAGHQTLGPGYLTEDRHSRFPASGCSPSCGDTRPLSAHEGPAGVLGGATLGGGRSSCRVVLPGACHGGRAIWAGDRVSWTDMPKRATSDPASGLAKSCQPASGSWCW